MPQEHDEQVWNWLKEHANPGDDFNDEAITGSRDDQVSDAYWKLVSAGILRPTANTRQFTLTSIGAEILSDAGSPYSTDTFYQSVTQKSSKLDDDAKGYFRIALNGLPGAPHGTLALFRAALEAEIWSLVDIYEATSKSGRVDDLHKRNLGERVDVLVTRIKGRQIVDDQLLEEFDAACTQIRIPANRVLHPNDGIPVVDANDICGISYSFGRMAELSTTLKERLES